MEIDSQRVHVPLWRLKEFWKALCNYCKLSYPGLSRNYTPHPKYTHTHTQTGPCVVSVCVCVTGRSRCTTCRWWQRRSRWWGADRCGRAGSPGYSPHGTTGPAARSPAAAPRCASGSHLHPGRSESTLAKPGAVLLALRWGACTHTHTHTTEDKNNL